MKAWSSWYPDLAPHVPRCPNPVMAHELRRAAQAFFSATRAWRVDLPVKPVAAGTESVLVQPADASQDLVRIEAAWFDGRQLSPVTPETLDAMHPTAWHEMTGSVEHYLEMEPGQLRLFRIPMADAQQGLKLRLSVTPSETATGLPDDIALRFRDAMHVGAKARLMLYPGKPWSNPELAAVYAQAFTGLIERANVNAARAHVNARIPSRPNWC